MSGRRGDEERIVTVFVAWLSVQGWTARAGTGPADGYIDILAVRGDERRVGEAKGRTSEPGIDADILFGQILRRMPNDPDPRYRYALVVPEEALPAVLHVPARVRTLLDIEVYPVDGANEVRLVA